MRPRSVLVLTLIVSLAILPGLQLAMAAQTSKSSTTSTTSTTRSDPSSPYFEKIDIYTAGAEAFWKATLNPVNVTAASFQAAESVSGVTAYQLTAVKTTTADAGSQLFWGDGYKVVKLPFMPDTGTFLNVTATSQSAAQSAASDLGSEVGGTFVPIGSTGTNYTFFAVSSFSGAGGAIFSFVPKSEGGLASLTSIPTLASQLAPVVSLTGVLSGSSFSHSLAFGSTAAGVVNAGKLVLSSVFNKANITVKSSAFATSTQVVVHSLDGLVSTTDSAATVTNNRQGFNGTYSLSVPSGSKIQPNVSLLADPPVLIATRTLDKGTANPGDLVTVTLTLRNSNFATPTGAITVNDSWWRAYPSLLEVSAGHPSFTAPSLDAGKNVSSVNVLKVLSSASNDIIIPAVPVSYSYGSGHSAVNSMVMTNQNELRTSGSGPVITIKADTDTSPTLPLGTKGHYLVAVSNLGNAPALDLVVGNFTHSTLVAGGVWNFNMTFPLTTIVDRNLTKTFTIQWTSPNGGQSSLVSNTDRVHLSHSGLLAPRMLFTLLGAITPASFKAGAANLTYTLTNGGTSPTTGVNVTQSLPAGMACKAITGTAKCTSSGFSVSGGVIAAGADVKGTLNVTFGSNNYIGLPASITSAEGGLTLRNAGTSFVLPAGILVTKAYAPNPVFAGQNDTVTVKVANQGSTGLSGLAVSTSGDSFATPLGGTLSKNYSSLPPNSSQSFNYTIKMITAGNHTAAGTTATFTVAGASQSFSFTSGSVLIYKAITATTSTQPTSPVEGTDFSLSVKVQNPASVNVTNVALSMTLPQGVTLVNGTEGVSLSGTTLSFSLPSLAAGASQTHTVKLKAASDGTIDLSSAKLTFQYLGQTIAGTISSPSIGVGVDLEVRYEAPIGVAVVLTLAVALYVHRKLSVPQTK